MPSNIRKFNARGQTRRIILTKVKTPKGITIIATDPNNPGSGYLEVEVEIPVSETIIVEKDILDWLRRESIPARIHAPQYTSAYLTRKKMDKRTDIPINEPWSMRRRKKK
jgi:hypothetical protein